MNEVEWLSALSPGPMLDHLDGKVSDRKLRLFACACVRRHWGLLRYPVPREAVELAERRAEGSVPDEELASMLERANQSAGDAPMFELPAYMAAAATLALHALEAARTAAEMGRQQAVREAAYEVSPGQDEQRATTAASACESRLQADLLREVIGNPFRSVRIDPVWLAADNGIVGSLARLFAEESRFDELPILADALQDAGCSEEVLLQHLREPGIHAKGCWVLDLLLGLS